MEQPELRCAAEARSRPAMEQPELRCAAEARSRPAMEQPELRCAAEARSRPAMEQPELRCAAEARSRSEMEQPELRCAAEARSRPAMEPTRAVEARIRRRERRRSRAVAEAGCRWATEQAAVKAKRLRRERSGPKAAAEAECRREGLELQDAAEAEIRRAMRGSAHRPESHRSRTRRRPNWPVEAEGWAVALRRTLPLQRPWEAKLPGRGGRRAGAAAARGPRRTREPRGRSEERRVGEE